MNLERSDGGHTGVVQRAMRATLVVDRFGCYPSLELRPDCLNHLERAVSQCGTEFHVAAALAGNMKNRAAWNSGFQHFLETQGLGAQLNVIAESLEVGSFGVLVFLAFATFVLDWKRGLVG